MVERLGFACKWLDDPSETANMKINARNRELNTGTTTVAWLAGIVIAKGFWSTFFALFLPLWAYYLVAERLAERLL